MIRQNNPSNNPPAGKTPNLYSPVERIGGALLFVSIPYPNEDYSR